MRGRGYKPNVLHNFPPLKVTKSPKLHADVSHTVDAHIIKTGFDPNTCRFNYQIDKLLRAGDLSRARQLYDQMPFRNTVTTNSLISGYIKSGNLSDAKKLFDGMLHRTAVTWTILIGGYSQSHQPLQAFKLFAEMKRREIEPDHVTFATLLACFDEVGTVNKVIQVHALVVQLGYNSSPLVSNTLIDCYCKSHCLDEAQRLFLEMPEKDSVSFNAMISGFSKVGLNEQAISLFQEMRSLNIEPSEFTFAAILCAGVGLGSIALGQQIHGSIIKANFIWNVFVSNALLDFYSKHDFVIDARRLFDEMPELDGVSYNMIITAHAWNGQLEQSLDLFRELQFTRFDRRQFPFATLLSLAANTADVEMGRQIHAHAIVTTAEDDILVANSLVDVYAKCERFEDAKVIFSHLAHQSTVPWTAMISGYVQKGLHEEGIKLFCEMQRANISPDQATFASVLRASASLASLSLGKQLHSCIFRSGYMSNVFSGSALVDTYAKCGSIKDAIQTFREMPYKNSVSWNAMISAFAQNGEGEATLASFEEMVRSGLQPDSVSFLTVLTACSHRGLVDKGFHYFNSMTQIYRVEPRREHYASMVDLLCRRGQFDEAEKLMGQMPFHPDEIMWTSVLNSCRIHKNHELAKRAADQLFNMELRDAAAYVNMSNIYAEAGHWDGVGKVKKAMRERGVRKVPAGNVLKKLALLRLGDLLQSLRIRYDLEFSTGSENILLLLLLSLLPLLPLLHLVLSNLFLEFIHPLLVRLLDLLLFRSQLERLPSHAHLGGGGTVLARPLPLPAGDFSGDYSVVSWLSEDRLVWVFLRWDGLSFGRRSIGSVVVDVHGGIIVGFGFRISLSLVLGTA
ncbi:Pentatricopeptide repeat [Dillenia turbinata]|uniref:Pentatricopeptide repeat n=1 Tax=Dillenia turbinata TaxID=194707 RepID=A0AAN8VBN4_9MAGN